MIDRVYVYLSTYLNNDKHKVIIVPFYMKYKDKG